MTKKDLQAATSLEISTGESEMNLFEIQIFQIKFPNMARFFITPRKQMETI